MLNNSELFNNDGLYKIISKDEIGLLTSQNSDLLVKIKDDPECKELFDSISNIDIDRITTIANSIEESIKNIVLVGIGGSSLGVRAFATLKFFKNNNKRNCYFMENIDPVSILSIMDSLLISETLFVFVSKSGFTIETLSQAEFIVNRLKEKKVDISKHCISITSVQENDLRRLSRENKITVYNWQGNIGGRFSAFTISTLLPLALLGCDLNKIVQACKDQNPKEGLTEAVINYLLWQKGYDVNVLMPYSDQLTSFALWYRQLWAESIGKQGFGSMPEISTGTIDQHSMLQMYLGGKKNKFFTLIEVDYSYLDLISTTNEYLRLDDSAIATQKLEVKLNHSSIFKTGTSMQFSEMLKCACEATASSMIEENCPVRIITIPIANEYYIAKMMIHFIYETIFTCYLANKYLGLNISPFGQPNVEKSKKNLIDSIKSTYSL